MRTDTKLGQRLEMREVIHRTANDANRLYINALAAILCYGEEVSPRTLKTRELRPLILRLTDSRSNVITIPERDLSYPFMVAEWLWIATGRDDVEMISHYNKNIAQFSDDKLRFYGAYGPAVHRQLPYVLEKLRTDHDTRQVVISFWRETPPVTKDVPCTLTLQFLRRNGVLETYVTMRSSDAWLGLPYDLFNFTQLQAGIAGELNIKSGPLTLYLSSAHLYEKNIEAATQIVLKYVDRFFEEVALPEGRCPELPYHPRINELYLPELLARKTGDYRSFLGLPQLNDAWVPYLEVLAYRSHRDLNRGDSFFMQLIRGVNFEKQKLRAAWPESAQ